jgi:hypothetical protein
VTIPELDIYRSANLLVGQFGVAAVAEARRHAATLQEQGDRQGADVWLRIIVAIATLLQSPPSRFS